MADSKDQALRAKEIAEKKLAENDLIGAKKFALEAQTLFPALEGLVQLTATLDVCIASQSKVDGEKDWHAILRVNSGADEDTVRKQYRKLALLLHPDKNKSAAAEDAFKLISQAWSVLSDKSRRTLEDSQEASQPNNKRAAAPGDANGSSKFSKRSKEPPASATFWTSCDRCGMQYEHLRVYLNLILLCLNCHASYVATAINPPSEFVSSEHTSLQSQPNLHCFQWGPSSSRTEGAASANVVEKAKRHGQRLERKNDVLKRKASAS
ncbi:chaperone protein dnaJ 49-like isoform X1 [Zingiber officinale]|uniref:J domain-containing protein n=1 Tax=Zingiber officinale TaxID=94328 RepID=A0A8J5EWD8_ZINOF|nr:chaperone protein dnaJ 49-like isoform X1 [Zingiber officinale]XP_042439234.1 chaperone protein dnaJ 49-like isoform X1 [Zingiber officinale]KAG6475450.1 hypothetical protein ZIOFF_064670 [Zingiber officinale]